MRSEKLLHRGVVRRSLLVTGVVAAGTVVTVLSPVVLGNGPRTPARPPRGPVSTQLPTTIEDFFQPGTQPQPGNPEFAQIEPSLACNSCHGGYLKGTTVEEPADGWVASMMAQAARDPIWQAALTIANQDANVSGELCIRCHAPRAWLGGRSASGDIHDFESFDFDGVNCHFCHRAVNPVLGTDSPAQDSAVLADLDFPPVGPGNGRYVIDPNDVRRGPFDDVPFNFHGVPIIYSPFHRKSALCGTCHDVSNPVYTLQPDGTYALNSYDMAHPTQSQYEMMPEQRTYSEWLNSQFAQGGVSFPDQRFGGNHATGVMKECQDCHMPDRFAGGCFAWESDPFFPRPDLPEHSFAGANTWVLSAVFEKDGYETGLDENIIADAQARIVTMLRNASDMEVAQKGGDLVVRVVNWSGHKLPTGYPEGRRMWLNVQFLDENDEIVEERGAYNYDTADLTTADTKVYESKFGIDEDVAAATGKTAGHTFHLVLNNVRAFDNRIPPIGFTNVAFETVQAEPVDYVYDDGQHWDDSNFAIPALATRAVVTLYYQTTSKEYIEFLRDTNTTDTRGTTAYDLWEMFGKSAPVDMDSTVLDLGPALIGDLNGDFVVNLFDLLDLLANWGPCNGPQLCLADLDDDGVVNVFDLLDLLANWGA